jgi:mannosyltransferase OCH1-like enzyme
MIQFTNKRLMIKKHNEDIKKHNEDIKKHNEQKQTIHSYMKLNQRFFLKENYNSIIPLHLYTCWHTKELPLKMKENYQFLIESNPKIQFHLYDEENCREFVQTHFEPNVLDAYNSLIPCSYKSDLWRYCILYINGGIYMDIKYKCVNGFKFISLTEKEHFVRDRPEKAVYTALIVTLPKNEIMLNCINQIVENVKNKYYGNGCLDPTGPILLGKNFTQNDNNNMEFYFNIFSVGNNKECVIYNDKIILQNYNEYREEQKNSPKNKHYGDLWNERNIYKT